MQFKKSILSLTAIAAFGLHGIAAATPITGAWAGNWSGSGITATFNMTVGAEDSFGHFAGQFDWTCTSGIACSGIESFAGNRVLFDSFAFWTTGFTNPINLGPSVYLGSIVGNGNTFTGIDSTPGDRWSATRITTSVPEPGTLALMFLGLLSVAFTLRRKLPAALIR